MKQQYRALVGLSYPTDPKIVERLLAGEEISWEDRGMKRVEPGEIVDDIPEVSLDWMLEQNCIELVKPARRARKGGA